MKGKYEFSVSLHPNKDPTQNSFSDTRRCRSTIE